MVSSPAARSLCIVSTNHRSLIIWRGLKEILGAPPGGGRDCALIVGHGGEDGEAGVEVFAEVHDGGDVAAAVAVVWGAPYCDDGFVFEVPLCGGIWLARRVSDVQWEKRKLTL